MQPAHSGSAISTVHGSDHVADRSSSSPLEPTTDSSSVPFTLSLREDSGHPGQFQLVVNVNSTTAPGIGGQAQPPRKLYSSLQAFPSLGYDISPLYNGKDALSPVTPSKDGQGWSDLSSVPSGLVKNIFPDWQPVLGKSECVSPSPSTRLNDFKARIKRSGRGFIVRLRKSSTSDSGRDDIKDFHLAEKEDKVSPAVYELGTPSNAAELDSTVETPNAVELDSTPIIPEIGSSSVHPRHCLPEPFDAGGRSPSTVPRHIGLPAENAPRPFRAAPSPTPVSPFIPAPTARASLSLETEWLSEAETLTHDVRPYDPWDDNDAQSSVAPDSTVTGRSTPTTRRSSLSSIISTPTGGLNGADRWSEATTTTPSRDRRTNSWEDLETMQGENEDSVLHGHKNTFLNVQAPRKTHEQASPTWRRVPKSAPSLERHTSHRTSSSFDIVFQDKLLNVNEEYRRTAARSSSASKTHANRPSSHEAHRRSNSSNAQRTGISKQRKPVSRNPSASSSKSLPKSGKLTLQTQDGHTVTSKNDILHPSITKMSPMQKKRKGSPGSRSTSSMPSSPSNVIGSNSRGGSPRHETKPPQVSPSLGAIPLPQDYDIRHVESTRGPSSSFMGLAFSGVLSGISKGISWLQEEYGSEPLVKEGFVRVRWTCQCGAPLYDDFIERRVGAARELEAYLNRPQACTVRAHGNSSGSTSSTASSTFSSIFSNQHNLSPTSTFGSQSSYDSSSRLYPKQNTATNPFSVVIGNPAPPSWLLTCANEGKFTTKLVHLDMCRNRIKSDRDFALTLREHYSRLNMRWFRWLKVRGLTTIHFVQFEVHRNRFADIRKSPDMPTGQYAKEFYEFEPHDLVPPVGEKYLLHLFKHPEDYDSELITYLRSPKRRDRLDMGVGWGIHLVEGFMAARVWSIILCVFAFGSLLFSCIWLLVRKEDVQTAFSVAAWMTALAGLIAAWLQATLD